MGSVSNNAAIQNLPYDGMKRAHNAAVVFHQLLQLRLPSL